MDIIPAIDIKDGRCVRLYQGDFDKATVYGEDPTEAARRWADQGARYLHVVDLDGAKVGHPVNTDSILAIVRSIGIPVQLGGGLRTDVSVRAALDLGVSRVILGTAAVRDPGLISRLVARHGDAIAIGVDARDGLVATSGWTESAPVYAVDLVEQMAQIGVARIVYTDITRDGTLTEPNFSATAALVRPGGPAIIASGGVCRVEHLRRLADSGVEAAIVGRALYTGDLNLVEALAALA
ncbi:MAG TPA: 1-(5-phosphoribosyl)-5-[(5-phosphoribosylamino)methylideneamino]imidazole-4-carboxamide isomerase [Roseiflexaceae bacterium]|nr:1-(5-phosphoribosyl)-5-[(5-phosphoribosylamino)methylideneamino]imidazole-4-carboxamide isomerase [Roseiflexaceae bacterium]